MPDTLQAGELEALEPTEDASTSMGQGARDEKANARARSNRSRSCAASGDGASKLFPSRSHRHEHGHHQHAGDKPKAHEHHRNLPHARTRVRGRQIAKVQRGGLTEAGAGVRGGVVLGPKGGTLDAGVLVGVLVFEEITPAEHTCVVEHRSDLHEIVFVNYIYIAQHSTSSLQVEHSFSA